MRPSLLIVFADEWAAYSCTLQNLVTLLAPDYDVEVLTFDNGRFRVDGLDRSVYRVARIAPPDEFNARESDPRLLHAKFLRDTINANLRHHERIDLYTAEKIRLLMPELARRDPGAVIAVDALSAFASAFFFDAITLVSLEFSRSELVRLLGRRVIRDVVIQTPERMRMLFGGEARPVHLIQNSHIFEEHEPPAAGSRLVYFGNIAETHGLRLMLDAIRLLPEFTLTMQGIADAATLRRLREDHGDLFASGCLAIDERYVAQEDVVRTLQQHSIGFCFYDIELLKRTVTRSTAYLVEHFRNCPSGKLFNYFAAGLPVVASDVPGLSSVRDHDAGVLLDPPSPEAVAAAVRTIAADHARFSRGAIAAARAHDFRAMARPFLDDLAARVNRDRPPGGVSAAAQAAAWLRAAESFRTLRHGVGRTEAHAMARISAALGGRPVVVHGAGELARYLHERCGLAKLDVRAFADGDRTKWSGKFLGKPVIDPDRIADHASDVVIASYAHEAAIAERLARTFGSRVRVHRLYESD